MKIDICYHFDAKIKQIPTDHLDEFEAMVAKWEWELEELQKRCDNDPSSADKMLPKEV